MTFDEFAYKYQLWDTKVQTKLFRKAFVAYENQQERLEQAYKWYLEDDQPQYIKSIGQYERDIYEPSFGSAEDEYAYNFYMLITNG